MEKLTFKQTFGDDTMTDYVHATMNRLRLTGYIDYLIIIVPVFSMY